MNRFTAWIFFIGGVVALPITYVIDDAIGFGIAFLFAVIGAADVADVLFGTQADHGY